MIRLLISILAALTCSSVFCQLSYEQTQAKADRFFAHEEWASAMANYNHLLREKPSEIANYGRAIVAAEMLGDSIRALDLLNQAMKYSVPLDSVLANVKKFSFKVGKGDMYEQFMIIAAKANPWMERPLDSYLLRYYDFRRNGPKMIEYAKKMLVSTPNNPECLSILAQGCMICGDFDQAVDAWKRILASDPENYDTLLMLANYYDINGSPDSALEYFLLASKVKSTPYVQDAIHRLEKKIE